MNFKSASVRMTLWNVGVLALALIGFAIAVALTVRTTMSESVDHRLLTGLQHETFKWHQGQARERAFAEHAQGQDGRPPQNGPPQNGQPQNGPPQSEPQNGPPPQAEPPPRDGRDGPLHDGPPHHGPLHHGDPSQDDSPNGTDGLMPPMPRLFTLQGRRLGPPGATQLPWDLTAFHEAAGGETVFSNVIQDDQPLRVLSAPLHAHGQTEAIVQIVYPLGEMQLLLDQLVQVLLTLIPFSLIVAGLGGLFLTDRVLQPIRKLRQVARDITARDLSHRIELTGNDEFTELTRTFNEMIGRLDSAFEQQRRFVADASHELRTPLSTVMGSASLALASPRSSAEYKQALEVSNTAATRMNRIVEDLLLLARSDSGQIDLEPQLAPVADLFVYARDAMNGVPGPPILLNLPDQSLVVQCDAEYLVRVFVNLLSNALRHTPPDGQVSMDAHVDGDFIVARVVDTGDGISADHVSRVGERFYRADTSRTRREGGTGLGLAICKSILHVHGGSLQIESLPGRGTTVSVRLPRPM